MNDETVRHQLQGVQGEEPTPEFVDGLRRRLGELERGPDGPEVRDRAPVVELDRPAVRRRPRPGWPLVAAAVVVVGALIGLPFVVDDDPGINVASTTELAQVGDAWLQSIIDDDRETFVALHADDLEVDDTLMGFAEDTELLTPARIVELYDDGFDAFQAAIDIDNDVVRSNGCAETGIETIRCSFTATMIGSADYRYTVMADLVVDDRLITSVDFSTTTDPADFRAFIQDFLAEEATDDDVACLALGFNTVGCGEHESDFITRYAAFYEAANDPPDS